MELCFGQFRLQHFNSTVRHKFVVVDNTTAVIWPPDDSAGSCQCWLRLEKVEARQGFADEVVRVETTSLSNPRSPFASNLWTLLDPSLSLTAAMSFPDEQVPPPAPPKWVLALQEGIPPRAKNASSFPDPPGYTSAKAVSGKQKSAVSTRKPPSQEDMDSLKLKKCWEIALAPAKQLPMQAIMAYMSGSSLQIFSIMMVFML